MKNKLSKREYDVLLQMSIGHKNSKIAEELKIDQKTVATYVARIIEKLGLSYLKNAECNTYLIVRRAIVLGIIL